MLPVWLSLCRIQAASSAISCSVLMTLAFLLLSHTVTRIDGEKRGGSGDLRGRCSRVLPIPGTQKKLYPCDTLLLSVGLLPENDLA